MSVDVRYILPFQFRAKTAGPEGSQSTPTTETWGGLRPATGRQYPGRVHVRLSPAVESLHPLLLRRLRGGAAIGYSATDTKTIH